ncbi:MAG TPA: choline ABC transporter ATP-binding protein [Steroidobacteraceae bacterium]|nr:choline ABC transporter ATP-binding protein [Steroidobacteraceae bacterium]
MSAAIEFRDVDILFPRERGRRGAQALAAALAKLDAGGTREEIAAECGVILGVAGASLAIEPGEICVMMGLSGSGKSTLLRAANGLNPVTRGEVMVADTNGPIDVARCAASDLRRLRRQRVAMVFQQFGLLPWRTVAENVGLGLELRGEPAAEQQRIVRQQLELVGLSDWGHCAVSELSGGMQQRVGLARAFATDADILLMDEPFSALDPLIRDKLQDELLALQARVKKTILFVSHDLDEALRLGDRISIMRNGRIVQTGAAQDIVLRPADDYVAEFVRRMNPLKVLTGAMVMRELEHADGALWLDTARRYRLQLDAGGVPSGLALDGAAHPLRAVEDDENCGEGERSVIVAPASITLQGLIHLRRRTGHPVLLADGGRLLGVAGEAEIIAALSVRRGTREAI